METGDLGLLGFGLLGFGLFGLLELKFISAKQWRPLRPSSSSMKGSLYALVTIDANARSRAAKFSSGVSSARGESAVVPVRLGGENE